MNLVNIAIGFLVFFIILRIIWWALGIQVIPNNRIGIVEKWNSPKGSLKDRIIALHGEAGFQPETLRGGIHFLSPIYYRVHQMPLVTIPQGQMGYIFARDGEPLPPTQTLGRVVPEGRTFQDARTFLENGGQRGPQREILREGTYAINLALFVVMLEDGIHFLSVNKGEDQMFSRMANIIHERGGFKPLVIKDKDDKTGIVTIHDGPSLPGGEIIAPTVGDENSDPVYHNNFQDPEKFLRAGGYRGRQYQVLAEGTYFINRLFATVELVEKVVIDVGYVGVVVSYFGEKGTDISGEDYKHGELVGIGYKGVWDTPLMPGKYAFNNYAGHIVPVPTTNIILKWMKEESGVHRFDENLSEVAIITKDAFEPSLPLSVVVHIDYRKAPLVIQRFGDVKLLVDQTLDPMVGAYFKNIAQTKTLIELVQERSSIQDAASLDMKVKFAHYNLELEEVLIGTPSYSEDHPDIEKILTQLRDRQIAMEQVETFSRQQIAATKERELRESQAIANQQTNLTESEIKIAVASNEGKAEYQRSLQDASKIKAIAEAEAEREARIGIAKAIAVEEQVKAYGGPQFQVLQVVMDRFADAIEKSGVEVVPRMVISGGGDGQKGGYSVFESLMAMLLSEKAGLMKNMSEPRAPSAMDPEIARMKQQILGSLGKKS
jgi:uncharacterized membrane protein YqiK